jgi:hypothetical protein
MHVESQFVLAHNERHVHSWHSSFAKECGRVSLESPFGPGTDLDFDAETGSMEPSFMCHRLTSEYVSKCIGKIAPVVHSPEEEIFTMNEAYGDAKPWGKKK